MLEVKVDSLRAAGERLQRIDEQLSEAARKVARELEPQWKQLVAAKASTKLERRVISGTARAVLIEDGVRLEAGKSGSALRCGLSIAKAAGPVEYGANRAKKKTYKRRSKRGGVHDVTRRTAAQFRSFNKTGHVFAPAVKAFVPKLSQSWFEGLQVTITDTIEG